MASDLRATPGLADIHVIRVGRVELERAATWNEIAAVAAREEIVLSCVDPVTEARMSQSSG